MHIFLIIREDPTKTDVDVLNVLKDITIDPNQYPNIKKWRDAVQQFSIEERER